MTTTMLANIDQNLIRNGRPIPFREYLAAIGASADDRGEIRAARDSYGRLQAEFRRQASTALGGIVASGQLETLKLHVSAYADGRRKITAILAEPKPAKPTRGPSAAERVAKAEAAAAAAKAEVDALRAEIAALKAGNIGKRASK